jgi:uncharacterized Zn finger protein (UPF0148 family)
VNPLVTESRNKNCPYCQSPVKRNEATVVCPECGISHHPECWEENEGCTTFGCRNQKILRQQVLNIGNLTPDEAVRLEVQGDSGLLINCPECNGLIEENSVYCKFCGKRINTDRGTDTFYSEFRERYEQKASLHKKQKILTLISSVILSIVIIVSVTISVSELSEILTPRYPEQIDFLNKWSHIWESKDLNAMADLMAEDYRYIGPDKKETSKHEKLLRLKWTFENYKYIDLKIKNVLVNADSVSSMLEFNQEYESDKFSETGIKRLYLKKTDGSWKIYQEEFMEQ